MAKRRSACDQLSRKSTLLGGISRTKQYAKTRSMGINSHPGYASSCPLSILPTPSRYSLEPIELLPRVIDWAPGGIDTPAQWLSFSYVRFASASARHFLTSRFRRIPFLIASDLSAFDNFRVVFLAFFIAIPFL